MSGISTLKGLEIRKMKFNIHGYLTISDIEAGRPSVSLEQVDEEELKATLEELELFGLIVEVHPCE